MTAYLFRFGVVTLFFVSVLLSVASVKAQEMPSQAEMEQLQQMLQQMQNDPQFQEHMQQMQRLLGDGGMEDLAPLLDPNFLSGVTAYTNCVSDGLGPNWMQSFSQRIQPYMEHAQGLCRAGRFNQAKAFLEDESNLEKVFSSQEIAVMERCEAIFPDQAMLQADPTDTGQEICRDILAE